ncbi:MAG TPA: XRE family transcriptional regulator [Deltaproteobacteria bacterium]|nr:XRE family transcriptional regulator [Deltaproteobacteria bacterium]HPP81075.1 XRE family transcriptional regulator [Deltaproteobacteria bacterium]
MKKKDDATFGARIRALRLEKGLSLEDLAGETGYPPELLGRVEDGLVAPPVALVLQLGRAFRVDIEQLAGETERRATQRRARSHKKRVASYAYTPLTNPAPDKHLRAYLVSLEAHEDHKGVEYHHEGEEFIYVLEGSLVVRVGRNVTTLEKGSSIHFNSALHHTLSNPSDLKTELLVVIYVP